MGPTKARLAWVDSDGRAVPESYPGPYDANCEACGTRPAEGVMLRNRWLLCPDCLEEELNPGGDLD